MTVYIIGAAVTFVLTFVIFWMLERQSEKEEREKELFPEYYEEQETKQDRIMVKLTFFILSVLVGGDMDRSSVHTGFYIHYVSDR